jgi:hypothetical protein
MTLKAIWWGKTLRVSSAPLRVGLDLGLELADALGARAGHDW